MEVILTKQDLEAFVNRAGFLPSSGERAPFCLEKLCPNPWHTDQASDPWRWRMEIAQEGNIAYGKFFHSLSGYIAADCLPAFIALRRGGLTARELYEDGLLGRESMALYELLEQEGGQPAHQLKRLAGLTGKRSGRFDAAMVQLQMRLLVSICGQTRKRNALGQEYGWQVACYECVERRFGQGEPLQPGQALEALTDRACGALAVDRQAVRALLDPFGLAR